MAVALAVLVCLSMLAVGGVHAVSATDTNDDPAHDVESYADIDDVEHVLDPADELYLEDDGSGVLVYTEDGDDDIDEFTLGADLGEGIAHVLIAGENDGDEDIEGGMSAALEEDAFAADGFLTMDQPPELEELDVEIVGEQTAENSEFEADIYALIGGEDGGIQQVSTAGATQAQAQQQQLFDSAGTSGDVEVGPDTFSTSGEFHVDFGDGAMADSPDEAFSFDLSETDGGYELEVSEREMTMDSMFADPVEDWETEAKAEASLEEEYAEMADELGGEVTIEIHHHEFEQQDETSYWKELDYTITYEGIQDGLEDAVVEELVDDSATDISEEEAEEIAAQITEIEIETVEFEMNSGDEIDASWEVVINDYAPVMEAMMDVSEASLEDEQADLFEDEFEDFDDMFEAQQAADLRSTFEWDATVGFTDDQRLELEATATGDSENYDDYTDELADRGIDVGEEEVTFEFNAYTEDGDVHLDGEFEVGMDDLAEEMVTSVTSVMQEESDELGSFASTLEDTELEIAKIDVDFDSETVEIEAGAKFEDTESLLEDGMLGDNVVVTQIVGDDENGDLATYVYLEDIETDDELDEDELAEAGLVDDDTEVYEPGEGDREFPEMDTEGAANFLDVDLDGDGIPGFGMAGAIVALGAVVAALLARRA
ncbi:hypothetical protein [Halobiforma nitratireducens]|uniref:PGF-CTERM sorting domain-containing protein n=1 Tax=Halobiforma nitratireducens JCM 10879 TaxID=1227454 RepID=M0MJZ3_9EURY|nr:hypothetical protein [Halobiforma nitratireducens]EMA45986.1 hypothetical protein C446_01868 [Halobiforma nitratireducens JCM 10879]